MKWELIMNSFGKKLVLLLSGTSITTPVILLNTTGNKKLGLIFHGFTLIMNGISILALSCIHLFGLILNSH